MARSGDMAVNDIVKWGAFSHSNRQWHYGVIVKEATSSDPEGPYVDVEYTHSRPASNIPAGRIVRIYGVHKVQPI